MSADVIQHPYVTVEIAPVSGTGTPPQAWSCKVTDRHGFPYVRLDIRGSQTAVLAALHKTLDELEWRVSYER